MTFLATYLEKTIIPKNTCTPKFIATARTWKQPKGLSTDEWIKKAWCIYIMEYSVQFSSVAQSCPTLCNPMNCSTPGLPVHHQVPEFTQTHVHRVGDASSHLILCRPLLLLPSIPPSIRVFSHESTLRMRWNITQLLKRMHLNQF